jgi:RNA polymerase primary sigma factor
MSGLVARIVKEILAGCTSPLTLEQLLNEIGDKGYPNVSKKDVEAYLFRGKSNGQVCELAILGRSAIGWTLTDSLKEKLGMIAPKVKSQSPNANQSAQSSLFDRLYTWQTKALGKWERSGCRGIVEAVTGTGKTMVALAAWEMLSKRERPLHTLIVVPTIELMNQWHDCFQTIFPEKRVGRIGDRFHDDFSRATVCISVINSAVAKLDKLFEHLRRCNAKTFLIADECHRYIDPRVFSRIRRFPFTFAMGLSATVEPFEVAGIGKVIFTYKFADAVRDGLVPRFDLVNSSVTLTGGEAADYERLTDKLRDQFELVKDVFSEELDGLEGKAFFRKLQSMVLKPDGTQERTIVRLFSLMFQRSKISYTAERKMILAKEVALTLLNEGRKKMLVFFERIKCAEEVQEEVDEAEHLERETAEHLASLVTSVGLNWCRVLHSGLAREERKQTLKEFREAKVAALFVCRVLDEGLDVPEIDAALLVASTQSERQRIQRIGRALRKGDGNKCPLIVTLFIPETTDRNVTGDDKEHFGEAADIYWETEESCVPRVRKLLEKADSHG